MEDSINKMEADFLNYCKKKGQELANQKIKLYLKKIPSNSKKWAGLATRIASEVGRELMLAIINKVEKIKNAKKRNKLKRYVVSLNKVSEKRAVCFSREEDGVKREYFGFPKSMSIKTRRKLLLGPTPREEFLRFILRSEF